MLSHMMCKSARPQQSADIGCSGILAMKIQHEQARCREIVLGAARAPRRFN